MRFTDDQGIRGQPEYDYKWLKPQLEGKEVVYLEKPCLHRVRIRRLSQWFGFIRARAELVDAPGFDQDPPDRWSFGSGQSLILKGSWHCSHGQSNLWSVYFAPLLVEQITRWVEERSTFTSTTQYYEVREFCWEWLEAQGDDVS